jgi:GNAT superfamily N-acetyltransferase
VTGHGSWRAAVADQGATGPPSRRTDVPPFDVVVLGPDDWERLRTIRLEALAESPTSFGSTLAREGQFQEADWRDRLRGSFNCVAHVDGVDAALVGGFLPGEVPVEAELVSLWVRPEYRGHGYGGHLVETVLLWASTLGCASVFAWATESNEAAIVIYENHGFVRTGDRQPLPSHPDLFEIGLRRVL